MDSPATKSLREIFSAYCGYVSLRIVGVYECMRVGECAKKFWARMDESLGKDAWGNVPVTENVV